MLTEPTCDCRRGFRKNGQLAWVLHVTPECPGNQPPPPPPPRLRGDYDIHTELRRVFRGLKDDLHRADGDLDAPARRDWPPNCDIVAAELTLGEQLRLLLGRADRLVTERGYLAGEALRRRVRRLLVESARPSVPDGFTAPPMTIVPPQAVALAMERLRPVTARGAALSTAQLHDTPDVSRDRRLVEWFTSVLED